MIAVIMLATSLTIHFTCIIMYYLLILCEPDSSFREKLQDMYLLLPEDFTYELIVVVTADTRPTQAKDKVNLNMERGDGCEVLPFSEEFLIGTVRGWGE